MKTYIISDNAAGQRLDRYLTKLFPSAGRNLLQRSLRKKNITLNRCKANAGDFLKSGDVVTVFFSDETIKKFSLRPSPNLKKNIPETFHDVFKSPLYDDDDLLVINKPAGLLTQPDASGKVSVSDYIAALLPKTETFHPATVNRLDLNTSGIILIPKTYAAQKKLSECIRKHQVTKEYLALVSGELNAPRKLIHFLNKNTTKNHVSVSEKQDDRIAKLKVAPIAQNNGTTLVSVQLETGRSHQIRVQLAADGHPIAGDPKYGDDAVNIFFRNTFNLHRQLLHSRHYAIPKMGLDFTAPLPKDFQLILQSLGYKEI